MMIPPPKLCRRSLLAVSVGLAIATASSPAARAEVTGIALPANMDVSDEYELHLQVRVNQLETGGLTRFVVRNDALSASPATLQLMGLKLPAASSGQALVPLQSLPGTSFHYDIPHQRIDLQVPVDMLDRSPTHLDLRRNDHPRPDPTQRAAGAVFNYDIHAQHGGDAGSLSSFSELRLFGIGAGIWGNTLAHVFSSKDGQRQGRTNSTRLDSSWQLDFPDTMLSLRIGDSISAAHEWSRALRIGGIRLSRNFSLQPYRITTPPASFVGEAVLPSTVDLYIDGIRQSSQQLPPGRFQLDSSPSLNGTGHASLVITDINGQSRTLDFALYGAPELLQAGLSDWSLELGKIRQDYGIRSFAYANQTVASTSLRHGLSDSLTMQWHAEGSRSIQQAGLGAVTLLGRRGGVLSASLAGSRTTDGNGRQHGLGYQWNSRQFSFSASTLRRNAAYRDLAAVHENASLPGRSEQAFAGISTPLGQLGISYVAQQHPELPRSRYASLSWSHTLPNHGQLNLSFNRDLGDTRGDSALAYWSQPLDRRTTRGAAVRHGRNGNQLSVEANHSAAHQGGLDWRAQLSASGEQRGARAEIARRGGHGQWLLGLEHDDARQRSTQLYASSNGALAWLGGHAHALPRIDDAFALVSTAGIADVPVLLDNRSVGRTNRRGQLFVSQLSAWQQNQISIDPQQLPADMQLDSTSKDVVPETRRGVLVPFAMRRTLAVHVGIRDSSGQWLPAGSLIQVHAPGSAPASSVVGHEGKVYLLDPPTQARLHFLAETGECIAMLPVFPAQDGRIDLEDVTCE